MITLRILIDIITFPDWSKYGLARESNNKYSQVSIKRSNWKPKEHTSTLYGDGRLLNSKHSITINSLKCLMSHRFSFLSRRYLTVNFTLLILMYFQD
jgi:hypothetical protein